MTHCIIYELKLVSQEPILFVTRPETWLSDGNETLSCIIPGSPGGGVHTAKGLGTPLHALDVDYCEGGDDFRLTRGYGKGPVCGWFIPDGRRARGGTRATHSDGTRVE